jgi:large subunit ribosomal protein L31
MKKDMHPTLHPVIFLDVSTGKEFITTSTLKSDETKKVGDVEYFVVRVEISSDSHPFYTKTQKLIDTGGRVNKFKEKMERAKQLQEAKA